MGTIETVNRQEVIKEEFVTELERRLHKVFLMDWAMGWVLEMAIREVIEKDMSEVDLFESIFSVWRKKCSQLTMLVMAHDDDESHLYSGLDMTKLSAEICLRWRQRFQHLSEELGIE